jgi:hypothetical protein
MGNYWFNGDKIMKIGDKVRVINKRDSNFKREGTIKKKDTTFDWKVCFTSKIDDFGLYDNIELQLIKPVRKWKFTRKEILKELNRFECVGFTNCDAVHGKVASFKFSGDFNLETVIKPMLLAKSEHTEDKSDMLSTKDSVECKDKRCSDCVSCNVGGVTCIRCYYYSNFEPKDNPILPDKPSRPTLKPIATFTYDSKKTTLLDIYLKQCELTDRINLLSEKI